MSTIAPRQARRRVSISADRHAQPDAQHHGSYTDDCGHHREIITVSGAAGAVLVIDRLTGSLGDPRLVAHVAADTAAENARILTGMYLAGGRRAGCRLMIATDLGDEFGEGASPPDTPAVDALDGHAEASSTGNLRDVPDVRACEPTNGHVDSGGALVHACVDERDGAIRGSEAA
jgi:hypothetical protein